MTWDGNHLACGEVDKRSGVVDRTVAEQMGKQCESVGCDHLVDEGRLPVQGFDRGTTGAIVLVVPCVEDFGKAFGNGGQTVRTGVGAVLGLANDELARAGGVAEVDPISDCGSLARD